MSNVIAGLNPAWQQTLVFESFNKNEVNRACQTSQFASGKGINALRSLRCCGGNATLLQFAGGATGKGITGFLNSINAEHITINSHQNTRICTTMIDQSDSSVTELIGAVEPLAPSVVTAMESEIEAMPQAEAILISGTCPAGVPESIYQTLLHRHKNYAFTIVDAYKGIEPVLADGNVNMLKINRNELTALSGIDDIKAGVAKLFSKYDIEIVLITDGPKQTHLFTAKLHMIFTLPTLNVINPIGAGDCTSGILLNKFAESRIKITDYQGKLLPHISTASLITICKEALAAASASCLTLTPGEFSQAEASEIAKSITVAEEIL